MDTSVDTEDVAAGAVLFKGGRELLCELLFDKEFLVVVIVHVRDRGLGYERRRIGLLCRDQLARQVGCSCFHCGGA